MGMPARKPLLPLSKADRYDGLCVLTFTAKGPLRQDARAKTDGRGSLSNAELDSLPLSEPWCRQDWRDTEGAGPNPLNSLLFLKWLWELEFCRQKAGSFEEKLSVKRIGGLKVDRLWQGGEN